MAVTTIQAVPNPLSDFQKIGHNTYVWTSEAYSAKSPLVLFCAWNAAASKHIAKYITTYRKLFPTSRILMIRCNTPDTLRSQASYAKLQTPALGVVREHVRNGGEVLVHSFSNGGANQLAHFVKLWKREEGTRLPMRAQIMDSSPGLGPWMKAHAAITLSLPRTLLWRIFGGVAVHFFLLLVYLSNMIRREEHRFVVLGRELNDPALFAVETPRVYLYSKADHMVGHDEVEEHADAAARAGFDIRKVRFEASPHVGHIREDEEKYWDAVMDAWKRGGK
ncbi:hypothetical protein BCR34DRAFT_341010 [Clohesyomyces aquaticus]|uniref:Indole-diterpene biosynthesis protein-like protein PaxU n=1 Tax=Clohesyomyces aquaticus TaxID=1231657 RepID=A0A1Y1ZKI4_9PLEO|nr:hypothetical protein BCR34DRAFT_341010 [Clohesyomyces aquaticus]